MKIKAVILPLAGAVMLLSGCSSMQQVTDNKGTAMPDIRRNDMNQMTAQMSTSQVQIYSLDKEMPQVVETGQAGIIAVSGSTDSVEVFAFDPVEHAKHKQELGGVEYAHDESVTVFPLDSGENPYGLHRLGKGQRGYPKTEKMPSKISDMKVPDIMPAKSGDDPIYVSPFVNGAIPVKMSAKVSGKEPSGDKKPLRQPVTPAFVAGHGVSSTIYFGHGSAKLDAKDRAIVLELVRSYNLKSNVAADTGIKVQGHASTRAETDDPVTRRIMNLKMSMKRALSVSKALIRAGVPSSKITTVAYGDTRPATTERGDGDKETASRRVEVYGAK